MPRWGPSDPREEGQPVFHPGDKEALEKIEGASYSGDLETVMNLVNSSELHPTRNYLDHALVMTMYQQQLHVAQYLLDSGANINRNAIGVASENASLPLFKFLVENGWDVNMSYDSGHTVLPLVVKDEALVKLLLDHGADPSLGSQIFNISDPLTPSINHSGEALDAAAAESSIAVFDLLLFRGAKLENSFPLHAAAGSSEDSGRIPMMAHLLELGVEIDGDDSSMGPFPAFSYGTPLHHAIRYNGIKKVKFLLSKGADISGKLHGVTALREAERCQRPEIVEILRGMS